MSDKLGLRQRKKEWRHRNSAAPGWMGNQRAERDRRPLLQFVGEGIDFGKVFCAAPWRRVADARHRFARDPFMNVPSLCARCWCPVDDWRHLTPIVR